MRARSKAVKKKERGVGSLSPETKSILRKNKSTQDAERVQQKQAPKFNEIEPNAVYGIDNSYKVRSSLAADSNKRDGNAAEQID